jgi:hypothetical protein
VDWIQGDKFKSLGALYAPKRKLPGDYDGIVNNFRKEKIVYTHTIYVKDLFEELKNIDSEFIVVTHNGDVNIDFPPPDNVKMWFSQNVNIIHKQIESIPIGLENDRWFPDMKKKEKMIAKMQEPHRNYYELTGNLLCMNFNIQTNPSKRTEPYRLLKDKTWVTVHMGYAFDKYLDDIYNHKFVLCPEGNGMDTHRTWETLYMGSIPVEKRNLNNRFYEDLPICFVDDWSQVTEKFLEDEYIRIKNLIWNHSKLEFKYWKERILSNA